LQPINMNAIQRYRTDSPDLAEKVQASLNHLMAARTTWPGAWTQAHSLGAEDVVVTHLLHLSGWLAGPDSATVFVLNTQALHPQSITLIDELSQRYGICMRQFAPEPAELQHLLSSTKPREIFESKAARLTCCEVRKVRPLSRALAGHVGWITGLRRSQSGGRASLNIVDTSQPITKLSPIADWTFGDVWAFIDNHQLPYNPLHDDFYPSIGCAPCTRAISLGEDLRAGRWWWETDEGQPTAKECGLHVNPIGAK